MQYAEASGLPQTWGFLSAKYDCGVHTWFFFLLSQYFTNQREEFEGTRESILVWLTEMDLQLTNVEHFSESDAEDKMRQLNVSAASSVSGEKAPLQKRTGQCKPECSRILQSSFHLCVCIAYRQGH